MQPAFASFAPYLTALVAHRQYVKVQYFTELHELITRNALIVKLETASGCPVAVLASGEPIPLSRLVSAGGQFSPGYEDYAPYCETCDC